VKISEIADNREQSDIRKSAMFDPEKVDSGSQLLSRKRWKSSISPQFMIDVSVDSIRDLVLSDAKAIPSLVSRVQFDSAVLFAITKMWKFGKQA
jgi:hypothetical protein